MNFISRFWMLVFGCLIFAGCAMQPPASEAKAAPAAQSTSVSFLVTGPDGVSHKWDGVQAYSQTLPNVSAIDAVYRPAGEIALVAVHVQLVDIETFKSGEDKTKQSVQVPAITGFAQDCPLKVGETCRVELHDKVILTVQRLGKSA